MMYQTPTLNFPVKMQRSSEKPRIRAFSDDLCILTAKFKIGAWYMIEVLLPGIWYGKVNQMSLDELKGSLLSVQEERERILQIGRAHV